MPPVVDQFISNGDVHLHVVGAVDPNGPLTVAIVPGLSESAEDWQFLVGALAPRSAAAISLRGRGRSSCPSAGYSLEDHTADIATFVGRLAAPRVILVAFSRSVSYALEYAFGRPPKLAGLVLLDYPPTHGALRAGWAEAFGQSTWRNRRVCDIVSPDVLKAIEAEAVARDLSERLNSVEVPTLVIRGGATGAVLSPEDASLYRARISRCSVLEFSESGHALWEPVPSKLSTAIAEFYDELLLENGS